MKTQVLRLIISVASFDYMMSLVSSNSPGTLQLLRDISPENDGTVLSTNFSAVTEFLRGQGYKVLGFSDGPPVVLIGDMAVSVKQVLEDISRGRITQFETHRIWRPGEDPPHVYYYLDTETKPKATMVRSAVKAWTDNTCIKFTELPEGKCDQKFDHGTICVGVFGGCWSYIGMVSAKKKAQKLSVPADCGVVSTTHEFGHALGNAHMQSRRDRDHFISANAHNMKVAIDSKTMEKDFKGTWSQADCLKKGDAVDWPVPYDFMSIMHYNWDAFTDDDHKGVYLTREARYQNILMYAFDSKYLQSHYDLYLVNTAYRCVKDWTKSCTANGKQVPKCKNLGYVGKDCKCLCPAAYDGTECQTKARDIFPPLPKAHVHVEVASAKTVTFTADQFSKQPPEPHYTWMDTNLQFITVVIHGKNDSLAAVYVEQDSSGTRRLWRAGDTVMRWLKYVECGLNGVIFLWGLSSKGQLRTECVTTFANHEAQGRWLRSRTNHLDIVSRTLVSTWINMPAASIQYFVSMKLHVTFEPRPQQRLQVKPCASEPCSGAGGKGTGNGTGLSGAAAAMVGSFKNPAVAAGAAAAVLVLLIIAGVAGFLIYRKRNEGSEDGDDSDKPAPSASSSGSSDDDSDSDDGKKPCNQQ